MILEVLFYVFFIIVLMNYSQSLLILLSLLGQHLLKELNHYLCDPQALSPLV